MSAQRLAPIALAIFASASIGAGALAFSNGAPEGFTASPASGGLSCVLCHAEFEVNSGPGSIGVLDLPALVVPDQTYLLRVRIEDPGMVGAGFELSVETPAGAHVGNLAIAEFEEEVFAFLCGHYAIPSLKKRLTIPHSSRRPRANARRLSFDRVAVGSGPSEKRRRVAFWVPAFAGMSGV